MESEPRESRWPEGNELEKQTDSQSTLAATGTGAASPNDNNGSSTPESSDLEKTVSDPGFPDGGVRAWLVVFGGWCCLFSSFGWIMIMGVFQDWYEHHTLREYSASTIAWIPSMQVCLMFLLAPIFGMVFDCYGPRALLIGGGLFQLVGVMLLSLCHKYYQVFLAQGICSAIGTSAMFYAGNNTVGRWFRRRRALALGLVSSGSSAGGLVGTIMTTRLFPSIGFPWTVRTMGFMYLALIGIALLTVQTRLEHRRKHFRLSALFRPLKEKPVALTAIASFFFFLGVFVPYDFLAGWAVQKHLGHRFGLNLLSIANGTSILGRILPSWAGDRFGRFNAMVVITGLTTIFTLAIWIPAQARASAVAFAILYGFTSGSFVALIPAVVAQLSPTAELGVRLGTNSLAVSIAVLFGNPIAGALLTADNGSFVGLQLFSGLTMAVGTAFFVLARLAQSTSIRGRV